MPFLTRQELTPLIFFLFRVTLQLDSSYGNAPCTAPPERAPRTLPDYRSSALVLYRWKEARTPPPPPRGFVFAGGPRSRNVCGVFFILAITSRHKRNGWLSHQRDDLNGWTRSTDHELNQRKCVTLRRDVLIGWTRLGTTNRT